MHPGMRSIKSSIHVEKQPAGVQMSRVANMPVHHLQCLDEQTKRCIKHSRVRRVSRERTNVKLRHYKRTGCSTSELWMHDLGFHWRTVNANKKLRVCHRQLFSSFSSDDL